MDHIFQNTLQKYHFHARPFCPSRCTGATHVYTTAQGSRLTGLTVVKHLGSLRNAQRVFAYPSPRHDIFAFSQPRS